MLHNQVFGSLFQNKQYQAINVIKAKLTQYFELVLKQFQKTEIGQTNQNNNFAQENISLFNDPELQLKNNKYKTTQTDQKYIKNNQNSQQINQISCNNNKDKNNQITEKIKINESSGNSYELIKMEPYGYPQKILEKIFVGLQKMKQGIYVTRF
ncbi:hypothetical protein PPERSA_06117 [Pseudocohnilembus persalinus]|uniref:Uncharacterized protein n=1 Tax=Pseudocohnilembus persalinus TaxID=266149 RepID=A0A0V0QVH3_PSEPJ|nr:hypothetical protein PPERSA_06117 [Pseudocohnilembus persalinus]|eukprot:KRX06235.1 hypothetical protein PPERSA_06117 [Pseudocohnilembus persalinus]